MKSWRTTLSGFGMIGCGIGALAAILLSGQTPTDLQWTMFGGLIAGGFGQFAAADNKQLPPKEPQ